VSSFLSREEMDEVLQVGREFFARPQDEKEMIRLENSDGVRGERTHELTD
jgi:isopenicillin N synthase-like dioxygenase